MHYALGIRAFLPQENRDPVQYTDLSLSFYSLTDEEDLLL